MNRPNCGKQLTTLQEAFERVTTKAFRENCAVRLYEVFGQDVFPIYAISGSISTLKIAYLWRGIPGSQNMEVFAFYVTDHPENDIRTALRLFEEQVKTNSVRVVDMNGGDLGRPDPA